MISENELKGWLCEKYDNLFDSGSSGYSVDVARNANKFLILDLFKNFLKEDFYEYYKKYKETNKK